jgi:formate--tetrahydrofolate ligase
MGVKVALNEAWAKGGKGALSLAEMVVEEAKKHNKELSYLYDTELPVEEKIEIIARKMYGATKVEYTAKARTQLKTISDLQLDKLPICIAKTQNSLSDNPKVRNRPENFAITIRDIEIASGAGFIIPIAGEIIRMPGLPKVPSAEVIDIDKEGNITGLF